MTAGLDDATGRSDHLPENRSFASIDRKPTVKNSWSKKLRSLKAAYCSSSKRSENYATTRILRICLKPSVLTQCPRFLSSE